MNLKKIISFVLLVFLFGFSFVKPAFAETFQLSGKITDASGTAVAGSGVDVVDTSSSVTVASTTSDSLGNYSVNIPEGSYDVKVTPPAASNFSPAIAPSHVIISDTVINFILVPVGSVSLSGHIYGPGGIPLPNQTVYLLAGDGSHATMNTDASGGYSLLPLPSGTQTLFIYSDNNDSSLHVPQRYDLSGSISLTQSTVLDIVLPAKKVNLRVQDPVGNPVSNVQIKVIGGSTVPIYGVNFSGETRYGYSSPLPTTDASGNVILWLLPNDASHWYRFTAIPPAGSSFTETTLDNIVVTSDRDVTLTMKQEVSLSGYIYGPSGNPLPNQVVYLGGKTVTTDVSGSYSFQISPGAQTFIIYSSGNDPSLHIPQYYDLSTSLSLTQNTVLDITLPAKQINLHVQDAAGNSVSNTEIKASGGTNVSFGSINASGEARYGYNAPAPKTDSFGNVTLWLFPNGANHWYTFTAIPPTGGGLLNTVLDKVVVTNDANITLTLQQTVSLNGHIYGPSGDPLPNQTVYLRAGDGSSTTVITDAGGSYEIQQTPAGAQTLSIYSNNNDPSLRIPQRYDLSGSFSLLQNTVLDIILPAKKVNLHVQDVAGNPLGDMEIKAVGTGSFSVGSTINLSGEVRYGYNAPAPKTDSFGNVTLWLLPNDASHWYTFSVTPPSGSIYAPFVLEHVTVSGDQDEVISLQFIHDRPITSVTLSPDPNAEGEYSDPVTVTLQATAASDFTIANTYYTVDGGSTQVYSAPFIVSGEGSHTIAYWSIDNVGVFESPNTKSFTIHVNQAPSVNPISGATIDEGNTYIASGSFSDSDSTLWTATIDYGDGSGLQPLTLSGTTFSLSHVYKDNGTYTITVSIIDNQGATGVGNATVTVNNVAPMVGVITAPFDPVAISTAISVSAPFTDPGVLDTHIAVWDWGDGTTNGTVTELNGSGSVSDSHTYTAAGVYTLTLSVTDKDGGVGTSVFQYVVVYDTSAGFVTGGGSITSPQGAYTQDASLSGKAIFGFTSKYQKGANVPTGSTQFRFIVANFGFKSTSYDWLVVGGARAQYKGSGTVNGSGDYGFLLTAIDGQVSGGGGIDKFRLKITDKTTGNVIYDNQIGASDTADPTISLDSGSIAIHN